MSTMTTATSQGLMSGRAARIALGINAYSLLHLAASGQLRTVAEPGRPLRFNESDVRRLAAERASALDATPERS